MAADFAGLARLLQATIRETEERCGSFEQASIGMKAVMAGGAAWTQHGHGDAAIAAARWWWAEVRVSGECLHRGWCTAAAR